jgi:hypothetical protein
MIITIDDNHLHKFATQVQTELGKYRDKVPEALALAKAIEILISERVATLTTDPDTWVWEFRDRHDLEMCAWERQRLAEREARRQLEAQTGKLSSVA